MSLILEEFIVTKSSSVGKPNPTLWIAGGGAAKIKRIPDGRKLEEPLSQQLLPSQWKLDLRIKHLFLGSGAAAAAEGVGRVLCG